MSDEEKDDSILTIESDEIQKLKELGITLDKGKKGEGDLIIKLYGKPMTFEIFGTIYSLYCRSQDFLHPYGKGSKYLADFLEEIRNTGRLTDEIKRKYKIL